jgi:single-stranded-DNA-specific exonuclease
VDPFTFQIGDCPRAEVSRLEAELGVTNALAQVLVRRGLSAPDRARSFLEADEEHSPWEFSGMRAAVDQILIHVRDRTPITIHGDYDVDGICSTAVLLRTLQAMGALVDSYLPDRLNDGYGLSTATVERLAARGTRLLITVDCGITAVEEVAAARAQGIDVVVTDHHAPRGDGILPPAPIVHPSIGEYPFSDLCGTAVAYKLAQALREAGGAMPGLGGQTGDPSAAGARPAPAEEDLDLVALATIADVVPLVGENRTLVRRGLRTLASTRKPGLRALMAASRVDPARVNERAVAFALAPRLNAAGRLYRADAGLELVLTSDPARATQVAEELDRANSERRAVELGIRLDAEAQVAALGPRAAYVLAGEAWHPGVVGIVAARLAETHGRPVVLIAMDGETGKGSGRSIEGFDLLGGLTACAEHLKRFGGHRAAAGVEIERSSLAPFAEMLCSYAESVLDPEHLVAIEHVDAIVGGGELGMSLAEELQRLAPFGRGNPGVSLMLADATFADVRPMGEGKHARFTVHSRGARARAVAFGTGGRLPVDDGAPVEATFTLEVNEWNGVSEPRLVLRRARPAPVPLAPPAPSAAGADELEELVLFRAA